MFDLNKLAADLDTALAKVDAIAGKAEGAITTGGPEAVKVLQEVQSVLAEVGPFFKMASPLIGMLANIFPHANPPTPAGQQ